MSNALSALFGQGLAFATKICLHIPLEVVRAVCEPRFPEEAVINACKAFSDSILATAKQWDVLEPMLRSAGVQSHVLAHSVGEYDVRGRRFVDGGTEVIHTALTSDDKSIRLYDYVRMREEDDLRPVFLEQALRHVSKLGHGAYRNGTVARIHDPRGLERADGQLYIARFGLHGEKRHLSVIRLQEDARYPAFDYCISAK